MNDPVRRRLCTGLLLSPLAAGLAGLAGCASAPRRHGYTETVQSVLVSEDGRHLVAIGSRHHYVFDAPAPLVRALRSPVHAHVTATFTPFKVDAQSHIAGEVTLVLADDTPPSLLREARELGFARDESTGRWTAASALTGQRYAGWTYEVGVQRDRLNRAYTVEIEADETVGSRVVDAAATPIRVAADGIQLIYYAPLAPVIIPMIFLLSARDR